MLYRRALMASLVLASLGAGCSYLKPVDPYASQRVPKPENAPVSEQTATATESAPQDKPAQQEKPAQTEQPASAPVQQPASAPVQQPVSAPVQQPVFAPAPAPAVQTPVSVQLPPVVLQQPTPAPAEHTAPAEKLEMRLQAEEPPKPRPTGPTADANLSAMLLAQNNTDVSYARLVPSRSGRDDVRKFAQRMLTDHIGVNTMVNELLNALDIGAVDNIASLDMRDESANKRDLMRDLSGYAFDSTYIENEVSYHRTFLVTIDEIILPRAKSEQLRNLVSAIRPAVAAHLAHAEQVRADVLSKR
jgi:putative membrane protein